MKKKIGLASIILTVALLMSGSLSADISKWARDAVFRMHSLELIPKRIDTVDSMQKAITREEFSEFLFNYYSYMTGNTEKDFIQKGIFQDTKNPKVEALFKLGVVNGISKTAFGPDKRISREEMATMFMRLMRMLDLDLKEASDQTFSDHQTISAWAREGVYFCKENALIGGRENNRFDPKANSTVQEVASIIDRACRYKEEARTRNTNTTDFNGFAIPKTNTSGIRFSSNVQEGLALRAVLGSFEQSKNKSIEEQLDDLYVAFRDQISNQDLLLLTDLARKEWSVTDRSYPYGITEYVKDGKRTRERPERKPFLKIDYMALMYVELYR